MTTTIYTTYEASLEASLWIADNHFNRTHGGIFEGWRYSCDCGFAVTFPGTTNCMDAQADGDDHYAAALEAFTATLTIVDPEPEPQPAYVPYEFNAAGAVTVRLPHTFYRDHEDRDLPAGQVIRETKAHLYVALDAPAFDDLWSDADHYASSGTATYGPESLGLISSARATLKALKAVARAALDGEDK